MPQSAFPSRSAFSFAARAAALEVFGGYERRIDAYPTDRFRVRWFTAGARIVTTPSW